MNIKLLTEQHLEFFSLTGGCTGSFESTLVKMPHCWKSHVTAHVPVKYAYGSMQAYQVEYVFFYVILSLYFRSDQNVVCSLP